MTAFVEVDGHWINPAHIAYFEPTWDNASVQVAFANTTIPLMLHVSRDEFLKALEGAS